MASSDRPAGEISRLHGTALIPITPHDTATSLVVSPSVNEASAEYGKDWWRIDTRVGRIFELQLSRGVFAEPQLFTDDELARDPIRQEFLASFGIAGGSGRWRCKTA